MKQKETLSSKDMDFIEDYQRNRKKRLRNIVIAILSVAALCGVISLIVFLITENSSNGYYEPYNDKHDSSALIDTTAVDTITADTISDFEDMRADVNGGIVKDYDLPGFIYTEESEDIYNIRIFIHINGSNISGKYYYVSTMEKYGDKPSTYIYFSGTIDSDNYIRMSAKYYGKDLVEQWEGKLFQNDESGICSFEGTMTGPAGDKYHVYGDDGGDYGC